MVKKRGFPIVVACCGVLGLSTALMYFLGIGLVFWGGWPEWNAFFVPLALFLVAVPYTLLLAYLFFRIRLGPWYLKNRAVSETISYACAHMDAGFLRGRREAMVNRLVLAQAYARQGNYEQAWMTLSECEVSRRYSGLALEWERWRMEIAMRTERWAEAHRSYERVAHIKQPTRSVVELLACRAELAVYEDDKYAYEAAINEALWMDDKNPRLLTSRMLGAMHFEGEEPSLLEEFIEKLELAKGAVSNNISDRKTAFDALLSSSQ